MIAALLFTLLPALTLAAPPSSPHITNLKFSGSGCPNDSGSVKSDSGTLGDSASFTFTQLKGSDTDNCQLHIIASGASQGWQVAVKTIEYSGNVHLKTGSSLDTITQVYWSENAGATSVLTGQVACTGPEINNGVTVRSSTNDPAWSKCTGSDGSPGILNVNARPVIQGNGGDYDVKSATWSLQWRKC